MLTDLNFLQTSVDQSMLTLDSHSVAGLVDESWEAVQAENREARERKRSRKFSRTGRQYANPFDTKKGRKSLNPFDDDSGSEEEEEEAAVLSSVLTPPALAPETSFNADVGVLQRACPCCLHSVAQRRLPLVHTGFYRAYLSVRLEVLKALTVAVAQCMEENSESTISFLDIHICGHSLGENY